MGWICVTLSVKPLIGVSVSGWVNGFVQATSENVLGLQPFSDRGSVNSLPNKHAHNYTESDNCRLQVCSLHHVKDQQCANPNLSLDLDYHSDDCKIEVDSDSSGLVPNGRPESVERSHTITKLSF